ncbi:glutamate racemase [Candidatus Micrarchaeum sp.]|uniref:aspartate/glutamate racemase family protein n=1 Tax=Candidatus Micrarchaeum sp. TaxID=2282148 RepID=UPI000B6DE396|nr:aspartate/glutamate racemase family protein [Candidatus Micrarchaeum sp.]OWP54008.1 MAG: hypothetical protein B2I19_00660 [Thermoplasmatales archaeon ARMAN]QRF73593.1 glutamate racemase [Candidatus Micrarchaeum sp.]
MLGGIGPEATSEFYNKLILRLQNRGMIRSNADFPQIIINSIPAPELIYDNISDEDLEPYFEGLKELASLDPELIVMVCNTIHIYHKELQKSIDVPILDLRKEVKGFLNAHDIRSTFIMGTPNTLGKGLYRFDGIKHIGPSAEERDMLTEAIFEFNKGNNYEKAKSTNMAIDICNRYVPSKADIAILGCTEFGVMLNKEPLPKISTIDILVDAVISRLACSSQ